MFRISWFFVVLFGLALAGATTMNLVLINQARKALDEGILATRPQGPVDGRHLALVIPDNTDSFFSGLIEGVREHSDEYGIAVQVFRYRENDPQEAESYFQLCLTSRLDGIIFFTGADEKLEIRQEQARKARVILIPVGTQATVKSGQGFIGSSSLLQGIESGTQVGLRKGRDARVGILLTSEGEGRAEDDPVYRGVQVALRSYPGATIVLAARAKPGILSGEEAAANLLRTDPSINVLVCSSAPITEGAAQVVVDQGRVGQLVIVGTDRSPTIDRLVDKGVIAASVVRDSQKMGRMALDTFLNSSKGVLFKTAIEVGFSVRVAKGSKP